MRTFVLISALALLLTVPAVAQEITPPPIPQLVGSVYPAAGGTENKPLPTSVQLGLTLNKESGSTVKAITWTIPRAVKLSTRGFKRCPGARARRSKCSPRSFVGAGAMSMRVGGGLTQLNYVVTVYKAGARRVRLAFTGQFDVVVASATIRGHRIRFRVPVTLQRPERDNYSYLTNFRLELGPAMAHRHAFAALGSCRGANHSYAVDLTLAKNPDPPSQPTASATAVSPCRA